MASAIRGTAEQELAGLAGRGAFAGGLGLCSASGRRWDLWGAAYWLHGGCSDDGFIDFRSALIGLGKKLFFQVLEDPDALADVVGRPDTPFMQAEGFQYVASKVYEEATGQDMPRGEAAALTKPAGGRFDFEDEDLMRQRFPKIVAKFPDMGD